MYELACYSKLPESIYKIDHPWKAKPMYDGTCAATFFGLYLVEFSGAIRGILHSFTRP